MHLKISEGFDDGLSFMVLDIDGGEGNVVARFETRDDAELFVRAKTLPPTSETLDIGDGQTTPAEVRIHLHGDGLFDIVNSGAGSLWCQTHDKFIKVLVGDKTAKYDGFEAKKLEAST